MDPDQQLTRLAAEVLARTKVVAMVGASPNPDRPSHQVMQVLLAHGYEVIPVTPRAQRILERRAYPDLAAVPAHLDIDLVDIFRRSELAGAHVDEAIARGAGAVWLQLGVIDHAAAERARAAGLDVVMNRCPAIELARGA